LLALVQAGHLRTEERDDAQVYVITPDGRRAAEEARSSMRWASIAAPTLEADEVVTVGTLHESLAASSPIRRRLAGSRQRAAIEGALARAHEDIARTIDAEPAETRGEDDG
jgi:hypothetical protein